MFFDTLKRWFTQHPDLLIVLCSGAIGGLLATAVQALLKHDGNLTTFVIPSITFGKAAMYALFGSIAAAFSVYIAANSRLDDLKRLTFFALLCGVTFPAILVKSVDPAAERAQEKLELGKQFAEDSPKAAATVATAALKQAPATQVDRATREAIAADTTAIIKELQRQGTPEAAQAATDIIDTARDSGYANTQPAPTDRPES